jgi:DNA-binding MarR family transcriptional regulator
MRPKRLTRIDYERLARWRYALRQFLHFSQRTTRQAGLSRSQHTLLLFVKVFPGARPSVSELAERLHVRHNSAVGLIDRCERAGLVRREKDAHDRRRVRVRLTAKADRLLNSLSLEHLGELATLQQAFPFPLEKSRRIRAR